MGNYLIVFLGAGLGGAMRHGANVAAVRLFPSGIALSTLFVNVAGSFLMGMLVEWLALKGDIPPSWRLFLATGVLGGFTTFSAFSLETALLYERGQFGWAALNVAASVVLSIAALFAGLFIVRQMGSGAAG